MRIAYPLVLAAFLAIGTSLPSTEQPAPSQSPQSPFRTGVDLVHLDVSVPDANDQPVTGLTADDFTVRENDKPQRVVAFLPMEVPPPAAVSAPWMRDIAPDVVTNTRETRRLVVILMDDGSRRRAVRQSYCRSRDPPSAGSAAAGAVPPAYRGHQQHSSGESVCEVYREIGTRGAGF